MREERRREIVGWRNEAFVFGSAGRGEANRSGENVVDGAEDGGSDSGASSSACSTWITWSIQCVQNVRVDVRKCAGANRSIRARCGSCGMLVIRERVSVRQ